MKSTIVLAFVFLFGVSIARAGDQIIYLPEGQRELTDILSPEEIYADSILQNGDNELDLSDLDASSVQAADAKVYIRVSKASQHLWVYIDGQNAPGWDWPVSTGTEQLRCPPAPAQCRIAHTPTGMRHPGSLDWEHYSSLYGNAPMHRAIQFVGGVYLHATYGNHIQMLGRRDSGGCIRQHPKNAERLYLLVKDTIEKYGRKAVIIHVTEN